MVDLTLETLDARLQAIEELVPTLTSIQKQLHDSFFSNPGYFPVVESVEEKTDE